MELDRLSGLVTSVGEGRGAGPDQVASVLAEVSQALEAKKAQMAPAVQRLKEVRAEYQQLDVSCP